MLRNVFFGIVLVAIQTPVLANIFESEILLKGTNAFAEKRAKEEAFAEVLVRVSGKKETLNRPSIRQALPKVDSYLSLFNYKQEGKQSSIVLTFDEEKIRTLLAQSQASYWGNPRPQLVVWMMETTPNVRRQISQSSNSPLIEALQQKAKERGLPIVISEQSVLPSEFSKGMSSTIIEQSMKYPNAEGVAVVKIDNGAVSWQFLPSLYAAQGNLDAVIDGRTTSRANQAMAVLVDEVADHYVRQHGVDFSRYQGEAIDITLNVDGLSSGKDFFMLEQKLEQLGSVGAVSLNKINQKMATFSLQLLTSEQDFHNELQRHHQLSVMNKVPEFIDGEIKTDQFELEEFVPLFAINEKEKAENLLMDESENIVMTETEISIDDDINENSNNVVVYYQWR